MKSAKTWFGLFIVLSLQLAQAAPPPYPTQDLKVVGQAKLNIWFWDIYHSTFYTQSGTYQKDQYPQALQINYLRDIEGQELIEQTKKEWQKLQVPTALAEQWLALLVKIFPDINQGDTLIVRVESNQTSHFYYNEQSIGTVDQANFGYHFLRIWLDEKCSYPKVCRQLRDN